MANEYSTAGTIISYGIETTAGDKPTKFTAIPNIVSVPDFNSEPETIEVTDLADLTHRRYIPGLQDTSGAQSYTVNLTQDFLDTWEAFVGAADAAALTNLSTWIQIDTRALDVSYYFKGIPSSLNISGIEVGEVLQTQAYITPNEIVGFDVKVAAT